MRITGSETDFGYGMRISLQKEAYVIVYNVNAVTLGALESGTTWVVERKRRDAVNNLIIHRK